MRSTCSIGSRSTPWSWCSLRGRATRRPIRVLPSRAAARRRTDFRLKARGNENAGLFEPGVLLRGAALENRHSRIDQREPLGLRRYFEVRPQLRLEVLEGRERGRKLLRLGAILMHEVHEGAAVLLQIDRVAHILVSDRAQLAHHGGDILLVLFRKARADGVLDPGHFHLASPVDWMDVTESLRRARAPGLRAPPRAATDPRWRRQATAAPQGPSRR